MAVGATLVHANQLDKYTIRAYKVTTAAKQRKARSRHFSLQAGTAGRIRRSRVATPQECHIIDSYDSYGPGTSQVARTRSPGHATLAEYLVMAVSIFTALSTWPFTARMETARRC